MSERAGRLAGRTAIVTGAASGLGRAIALRFAAEGANVVASDLQPEPLGTRAAETPTVAAIIAAGGHAVFQRADVTSSADVDALVSEATAITGRLDIVVNNAGTFGISPLLETSEEKWDADLSLNLRSHYLMSKRAIEQFLRQESIDEVRGRIVSIASQLGITAAPGATTYGVAKAGVAQLTRQLAVDFAADGIIVNAIAPGRIITGTLQAERDYLEKGTIDEATRFSLSRTPFPRLGRPEDVAGAALFLASDDATFVSGHTLAVDGGWLAY